MLIDHKIAQEQYSHAYRERRKLPPAYGRFIATLPHLDWFVNPLTLRDRGTGLGPPSPDAARKLIQEFFSDVQKAAAEPIGVVLAEEFGRLGSRYHCHALVAGVKYLSRAFWQAEAERRFGYTRIQAFDPTRGAAYYAAKYAGRLPGKIHFWGTLAGIDLSKCEESQTRGGARDIAISASLPKSLFRMTLPRRHR